MSITNQAIIDQALGQISIVEAGESASASDSADTMTYLNQMMAEWKVSGKDLQFFNQDDLTDTCPIPDWAISGVMNNLAKYVAPLFRVPLSQEVAILAMQGDNVISRTLLNLNLDQADMRHMPQGEGRYGHSILTDS